MPFKRQLVKYLSSIYYILLKKLESFAIANDPRIFSNKNNNTTVNICTFEKYIKEEFFFLISTGHIIQLKAGLGQSVCPLVT